MVWFDLILLDALCGFWSLAARFFRGYGEGKVSLFDVEWADDTWFSLLEDMRVDHGGTDVFVSQ